MNQSIFIGNLTKTAETKQVNGGNPFTTFTVAVNRKWKAKDGTKREDVQFVDCIMNGNTSGIAPYLTKGTKVCVTGRISCHAWVDNQGKAIAGLDLNVREIELLGGKQECQQVAPQQLHLHHRRSRAHNLHNQYCHKSLSAGITCTADETKTICPSDNEIRFE